MTLVGLALRALLMAVWSVAMEPDVSLTVTRTSPDFCMTKLVFGAVYSMRCTPWPACKQAVKMKDTIAPMVTLLKNSMVVLISHKWIGLQYHRRKRRPAIQLKISPIMGMGTPASPHPPA